MGIFMKQTNTTGSTKRTLSSLTTAILPIGLALFATGASADWSAQKKVKIGSTTYGLYKAEDQHGAFVDFSIDTSTDGGVTWTGSPTTILSAADLAGKGEDPSSDYSRSILRSVKWVQCPGSGTWSIWVKRHGIDANNTLIVRKELLRASGSIVNSPYTDNIVIDKPYGFSSGDLGTVIENGDMHIISAATDEGAINIYKMNDTCSDLVPEGPAASLEWHLEDGSIDHREAPSLMNENGYYYMVTSGKTSWRPNQQKVSYATTLSGPWSDLVNVGDSTAYHSQLFGVKKYTATDGSGKSVRVFSGTRNQQMWMGTEGSPKIEMPWYWNTPTAPASNYYDETIIDPVTAEVTTVQYDHGTRLDIQAATLASHADFLDYLIDGDESTSWHNNDNANKNVIEFDLGDSHTIKALKVKLYDFYNGLFLDVTNRVVKVRIEIGDGATYTNVYEDIIPTIEWLQSINFADTNGSKVRMTLLESHSGNHDTTNMHWGFYEVQAWGDSSPASPTLYNGFSNDTVDTTPDGWTVESSTNASALIKGANTKYIELADTSTSEKVVVRQSFLPQSGSKVEFKTKFKFKQKLSGEYIRLKAGTDLAFELTNSNQFDGLAIVDAAGVQTKVSDFNINAWYQLKVNVNTDAGTYDVFIDDTLVWGGATLVTNVDYVDEVLIGTNKGNNNTISRFDDIRIKGPIRDLAQPIPTLYVTDFEASTSDDDWTIVSGTWERKWNAGFNSTIFRNTSNTTDTAMVGDLSWQDYDVSVDVRRENPGVGLLGRYNSETQYYQFQMKRDNTFQLSRMNNGNWTTLAEGEFINADYEFHNLKLSFRGNEINAYIDGNVVATAIDTLIPTGAIAIKSVGGGYNSFDNVVVSQ